MNFAEAVDRYIADMWSQGRMRSPSTERSYRSILKRHREDVENRDAQYVGRTDVKRTLARCPNPNTQRVGRAVLVSFYDWTMEAGYRKHNPARQTRSPKKQPTHVYRLVREEAVAMLGAARSTRERRAIYLGICAGLRMRSCADCRAPIFNEQVGYGSQLTSRRVRASGGCR